jgi:hypothetical protein
MQQGVEGVPDEFIPSETKIRLCVNMQLVLPNEDTTMEEICWHNMKQCDDAKHLTFFSASTQAWFKLNPTMSYQDLETELRKREFDTHIIAAPNNGHVKYDLGRYYDPNAKNINYTHYPIISCRPKEHALKELANYHPSYEHNYRKLDKVGDIMNVHAFMPINEDDKLEKIVTHERKIYVELVACKYVIHLQFLEV